MNNYYLSQNSSSGYNIQPHDTAVYQFEYDFSSGGYIPLIMTSSNATLYIASSTEYIFLGVVCTNIDNISSGTVTLSALVQNVDDDVNMYWNGFVLSNTTWIGLSI